MIEAACIRPSLSSHEALVCVPIVLFTKFTSVARSTDASVGLGQFRAGCPVLAFMRGAFVHFSLTHFSHETFFTHASIIIAIKKYTQMAIYNYKHPLLELSSRKTFSIQARLLWATVKIYPSFAEFTYNAKSLTCLIQTLMNAKRKLFYT